MNAQQIVSEENVRSALPETLPSRPDERVDVAGEIRGPAISRDQILVVTKISCFKWDQLSSGMSQEQLLDHYRQHGEDGERILGSHLRQMQVTRDLCKEIPANQVVSIAKLSAERIKGAKLVIALGGDDTLKAVSHWIDDDTILVGLNSDVVLSEGNLIRYSAVDAPRLIANIERGEYSMQPWARIRIAIDGVDQGPALSEIVLGKLDFRKMSRHLLEVHGEKVLQKSSGLLVSTGAGSTGWYTSAGLYLAPEGRPYGRTEMVARFELREPHMRFTRTEGGGLKANFPKLVDGEFHEGEVLRVTSLNNSDGIASRDSIDTIPFSRGTVAEISLDSKPIWVVSSDRGAAET